MKRSIETEINISIQISSGKRRKSQAQPFLVVTQPSRLLAIIYFVRAVSVCAYNFFVIVPSIYYRACSNAR